MFLLIDHICGVYCFEGVNNIVYFWLLYTPCKIF